MPSRLLHLTRSGPDEVTGALAALRAELRVPSMFPAEVRAEAEEAARSGGRPPAAITGGRKDPVRSDRRDVELVTIDPAGSMDLDQAVHVASSGRGYIVRYAIADVAAFVEPDGPLDAETHRRGATVYGPDVRTPMLPPVLSTGAASLLPDQDRPAVLWTIALDPSGEITSAAVTRALVRSRARITYGEAQSSLDAGLAPESLTLLADVGRLRQERERARGGVSLDVPEQEVVPGPDGGLAIEMRRTLPVEGWNAQISLLTGIAAAAMMRDAGVGLLRTLPEPEPRDVARLHGVAAALGVTWPDGVPYAEVLRTLESGKPAHAAFLAEATSLFRGAGYLAFGVRGDGAEQSLPADAAHAAIAAEYAHVTAPLRRLADRYATEVCLAHAAGRPVPGWVRDALPELPGTMATTARRASRFERGCVDVVEAALLEGRVGERFSGVVVDVDDAPDDGVGRGEVMLRDPAVRAPLEGAGLPLGQRVDVILKEASVADRRVRFALA
ncbi:RNB domain-containing ribonuclease [Isoptericola sp. BMS4]|uniref:RNB domain-containing ribonuclease n=1 Tax=Isoptericola sp. BMS4 TaxID=2527875 RepID=UPI001F0D697C|nr:RNB domain-containing ribonuclease [Isoptericola sp. BMS4]